MNVKILKIRTRGDTAKVYIRDSGDVRIENGVYTPKGQAQLMKAFSEACVQKQIDRRCKHFGQAKH